MVAYIVPVCDGWGNQINENENSRIALESEREDPQYRVSMRKVGHPRAFPNKLMVYNEIPYLPFESDIDTYTEFKERIEHALSKPVMHRHEFDVIL